MHETCVERCRKCEETGELCRGVDSTHVFRISPEPDGFCRFCGIFLGSIDSLKDGKFENMMKTLEICLFVDGNFSRVYLILKALESFEGYLYTRQTPSKPT